MMERGDSVTFITGEREGRSIWSADPAGPAAAWQHLHCSHHAAGASSSPCAGYQRAAPALLWAGRLRASSSSLCSLQGFIYTGKDKKIVPMEQCFWCSCWNNALTENVFFLSLFLCSSSSFVKYIMTCYLPHSEALRPFVAYSLLGLSKWIAVYLQQILQEAIGVTCGKCNLIPYMHMFKWSAIKQT